VRRLLHGKVPGGGRDRVAAHVSGLPDSGGWTLRFHSFRPESGKEVTMKRNVCVLTGIMLLSMVATGFSGNWPGSGGWGMKGA